MTGSITFEVRYRTLNWDGSPMNLVAYRRSTLHGVVTESQALNTARVRADELRKYHLFVDVVRVGRRGGERFM